LSDWATIEHPAPEDFGVGKRDDDELISYITTGLKMIVTNVERVLEGEQRFWAYDDHYYRRRRPKRDVAPAGPPRS
jgi:hypothetical protein